MRAVAGQPARHEHGRRQVFRIYAAIYQNAVRRTHTYANSGRSMRRASGCKCLPRRHRIRAARAAASVRTSGRQGGQHYAGATICPATELHPEGEVRAGSMSINDGVAEDTHTVSEGSCHAPIFEKRPEVINPPRLTEHGCCLSQPATEPAQRCENMLCRSVFDSTEFRCQEGHGRMIKFTIKSNVLHS